MEQFYSKKTIERFTHPKNFGEIKEADGIGEAGNPRCGDIMKVYIKVDDKGIIRDAKFHTLGCAAAIASSDIACDLVKGKKVDEAVEIDYKQIVSQLGSLPSLKIHCSVLAKEGLTSAVEDYHRRNKKVKVAVAMSGGVDSTAAAAILKEQGYEIIGVYAQLWGKKDENRRAEEKAREAAEKLEIPFRVVNLKKEFKRKVIDVFVEKNRKGLTPNPCVICNRDIKFGLLLDKSLEMGVDFFATGHYARRQKRSSEVKLLKAKDKEKDQSYFLWGINREQLAKVLFPVGDYTRKEAEKIVEGLGIDFNKSDSSQGICFVPEGADKFLEKKLGRRPGKIIDDQGNFLGNHPGLWFFTAGQRKRIGLAGGPYFVTGKDNKRNFLLVSKDKKKLYQKKAIVKQLNWFSSTEMPLNNPFNVKVKIRYRHNSVSATIVRRGRKEVEVIFDRPQRAVTPGQSAVFYRGEEVLGGGIIS